MVSKLKKFFKNISTFNLYIYFHYKIGKFPLGTLVLSKVGWVSHYVSTGENLSPISFDIGSTPLSYTLGTLGMPGFKFDYFHLIYSNKNNFY
jgi:NADPH-dependent curcumin reductase CurA